MTGVQGDEIMSPTRLAAGVFGSSDEANVAFRSRGLVRSCVTYLGSHRFRARAVPGAVA